MKKQNSSSMNSIKTHPNQKVVTTNYFGRGEAEKYGIITKREMIVSSKLLNDGTASHILYTWFSLNQDGYVFALSPKEIECCLGITKKQYDKAIRKLEEAGYLVRSSETSNKYNFYTLPPQYNNVELLDNVEDDTPLEVGINDEVYPPRGRDDTPLEVGINDEVYPPRGRDDTPLEVGRNNTNITNNNNNTNITNNNMDDDVTNKLIEEKDKIIKQFNYDFGHDDYLYISKEVTEVNDCIEKNNMQRFKNALQELKMRIFKMYEWREKRLQCARHIYRFQLDKYSTPKDMIENMKLKCILDKYDKEHPGDVFCKAGKKYGRWVTGWNEEYKEPIIEVALFPLPLEQLQKRKHNIKDIPKEYYTSK